MTKAEMVSKPNLYFACAHCGADDQHSVTHFLPDKTDHGFGPWQCRACGWVVSGVWHHGSKTVSITDIRERPKPIDGHMLLRVRGSNPPVWFVVDNQIHTRDGIGTMAEEMANKQYWVDEHTCPTNIVPVDAIIEGIGEDYDDDPHGVLEFVAWAPAREGDEDSDWRVIFPQLAEG